MLGTIFDTVAFHREGRAVWLYTPVLTRVFTERGEPCDCIPQSVTRVPTERGEPVTPYPRVLHAVSSKPSEHLCFLRVWTGGQIAKCMVFALGYSLSYSAPCPSSTVKWMEMISGPHGRWSDGRFAWLFALREAVHQGEPSGDQVSYMGRILSGRRFLAIQYLYFPRKLCISLDW